ncbi:helix-turn-helix domain-containing protein [Ectobacillus polymachus]|uniref:helix-turn-helix domain-containing protein n=1 Tax=Ectobacillus polymachus TaxID=1508806 RepID=UPI003A896FD0
MNNFIDIQYICHMICKTFTVPVCFLSTDKNILYESTPNDSYNPFYSSKEKQLHELYQESDFFDFPLIKTNPYLENFVVIHITNHEHIKGTLIIGPSMHTKLSEKMIIKLMSKFNLITGLQNVLNYFHSVPEIKKISLIHISILLHYMIYNEKLDISTVWKKNKLLEEKSYDIINLDLYISTRHQSNPVHYDISIEKQFLNTIKEGNKEKLIEYAYAFPLETAGILSTTDQLRNQKNYGIIAIALATRYAIDGNLPSEIAFSLSDLYIQTLEELNDLHAINRLLENALCTFADRVKEYSVHKYSSTITACLNHISKNIYHEISLQDLASVTNINPSYLSQLFKKEVGIPLSEYIQRERIEEAKKLLTLTKYPLSDICTWLTFNDQSYFTKIFKKVTNTTPRQYRQTYTVI